LPTPWRDRLGFQAEAWGLPTYALFGIVNRQLAANDVRLFALGSGNDLFEIFMPTAQAEKAGRALPRKTDWPYLATPEPPWFGMFHN
jgi:hypothetical protein